MKVSCASLTLVGVLTLACFGQETGQDPVADNAFSATDLEQAGRAAQEAASEARYWALQASRYAQGDGQGLRGRHASDEATQRKARIEARRWLGQSASRPTFYIHSSLGPAHDLFDAPMPSYYRPRYLHGGYRRSLVVAIRRSYAPSYLTIKTDPPADRPSCCGPIDSASRARFPTPARILRNNAGSRAST